MAEIPLKPPKEDSCFNDGTKNSTGEECSLANHVFLSHPQLVWERFQSGLKARKPACVIPGNCKVRLMTLGAASRKNLQSKFALLNCSVILP